MRFHSRFARGIWFLAVAGAPALLRGQSPAPPSLGAAASFAVMGGSSVTSTGSTVITGNLGVSPGNAISGSPIVKIGAIYRNDSVARQAQRDATAAYDDLAGRTCTANLSTDLGGMILGPGVYCFSSSALLTGTPLIVDGANDPNAVWIFKIGSSLTTASSVRVINGGHESHIFWQAGNTVTLGADTAFLGNVLSLKDVVLGSGASLSGRLLAQGVVSLAGNNVSLCCGDITLSPATLPNGIQGTPYRHQIAASGGLGNYVFTSVAQPLSGLALSTTGVLSGIPTAGRFVFTVTATDSTNVCSAAQTYTIDIVCPTLTMSPSAIPPTPTVPFVLPPATACIPYVLKFGDGCTLPHHFILTPAGPSGGPPPAQLDATTGVLLWTPKKSGVYTFTVSDGSVSQIYQVMVACEAISISPLTLPDGQVCAQYDQPITAAGCDPPYVLSLEAGNLPPGLELNPAGNAIVGTPTKRGPYPFTLKATDDDDPACFTTRNYTINITCPPITISPQPLPPATTCQRHCVQLMSSCAIGATSFEVPAADLPPGLSLSTDGLLCGMPSTAGTYSFTVTFAGTDSGCTGSVTYTLTVTGLTVTPAILPTATPGVPYNEILTASGGTAPYTFSQSGSLPPGLIFTQTTPTTATITGTPTTVGCSPVTVTVTDANGCTITITYTICTAAGGPTLSGWGMAVLAILLAGVGFLMISKGDLHV